MSLDHVLSMVLTNKHYMVGSYDQHYQYITNQYTYNFIIY